MALTQSAWSSKTVNNGKNAIHTCTVASTTAENDAYTLKTPVSLDTTRPFTLTYKASNTPDGQALPLDIWAGYSDSFAISGDGGTVAATDGFKLKQMFDDVVLAVTPLVYSFVIDPDLPVAEVVGVSAIATGPKIRIPKGIPYLAFNLNGGSTLAAVTHTFTIVQ